MAKKSMQKVVGVFLGAGAPRRGTTHSGLQTSFLNDSPMERLLAMYHSVCDDIIFVGGYDIDILLNKYPHVYFIKNKQWRTTGSAYSLSLVNLDKETTYLISYTDVVYTQQVLTEILYSPAPTCFAIDTSPCSRYEGRTCSSHSGMLQKNKNLFSLASRKDYRKDGIIEFAGVMKLSGEVLSAFIEQQYRPADYSTWHLHQLIDHYSNQGLHIGSVDATGQWAELNAPQDLANFALSSKAKTLKRLYGTIKKSVVLPQVSFTVNQWEKNSSKVISDITSKFSDTTLAIRSSSTLEDSWGNSQAGAFDSVLAIEATPSSIKKNVLKVIASYPNIDPQNEVLVQPFLQNISVSGVIFTRSLNSGAPYYVINYDESGACDGVTSGCGTELRTTFIYHGESSMPKGTPSTLSSLPTAIQEIIAVSGHDSLDIEFAVTTAGQLFILQVRPIAVDHSKWKVEDEEVRRALSFGKETIDAMQLPSSTLFGSRTILGNMPDWNPAEIIGVAPETLSYSLYRYLITDEIWSIQRSEFGYKDVRYSPLLVQIAGHPYVDTRASFSSFIPNDVPHELADKLVNAYLDRLENNPHLHDKIEFEIALTCLSLDFDEKSQWLLDSGFSPEELATLKKSLRRINENALPILNDSFASISRLENEIKRISSSNESPLRKAFQFLYICKKHGTIAFSHLARIGFIAVTILRSFVEKQIVSQQELEAYFQSMQTVAKKFSEDQARFSNNEISLSDITDLYGHLRPGTYDICSPCYASDPDFYFKGTPSKNNEEHDVTALNSFLDKISTWLKHSALSLALPTDPETALTLFRQGIEGREYAKFIFTKSLGNALECIADFGAKLGIPRNDLAHLSIHDLEAVLVGQCGADNTTWLSSRITQAKKTHQITRAVELPSLIVTSDDLFCFELTKGQPNFIGSASCIASSVCLTADTASSPLRGKIVCIERADPGFDWLFSHDLAGLVTCFGGANSHMAIRAAELQLPAAIGVGESLFQRMRKAERLHLDCANRTLEAV